MEDEAHEEIHHAVDELKRLDPTAIFAAVNHALRLLIIKPPLWQMLAQIKNTDGWFSFSFAPYNDALNFGLYFIVPY